MRDAGAPGGRWSRWRGREGADSSRRRSLLRELPVLLVVALALAVLVKTFLVQAFFIPSGSMETTLHGCAGCTGDRVLVLKPPYWFADPEPGDIVVFEGPNTWTSQTQAAESEGVVSAVLTFLGRAVGVGPPAEDDFVKRVIAVGGQTVQCCDEAGRVTVDGAPLEEPYVFQDSPLTDGPGGRAFGPVTLLEDQLWVMGDHRSQSSDSRVHGPIGVADVIGKASVVVWPLSRVTVLDDPDIQAVAGGAGTTGALGGGLLLATAHAVARRRGEPRAGGGGTADARAPPRPAPLLDR
ncbi:signal peptidase I [Modestobacter sp. Leaf380]|uniref:signal peptidase I n=1 Tax=Modestobacter sp. Leaf380 TaxID=1736356 RepID=UPI000A617195|nr:signal peptidase I [Modestobacter sp. Leaf380]